MARQKLSCFEWLLVLSHAERASWGDLKPYPRIRLPGNAGFCNHPSWSTPCSSLIGKLASQASVEDSLTLKKTLVPVSKRYCRGRAEPGAKGPCSPLWLRLQCLFCVHEAVMNSPPFFSLGLLWEFPVIQFLRIGGILDRYRLHCCLSFLLFVLALPRQSMCLRARSAEAPAASRGTRERGAGPRPAYRRWSRCGGGEGLTGWSPARSVFSGEALGSGL